MESEKISIWRRLGFKIVQFLFTCQTWFISFRTLDYVTGISRLFVEDHDEQDVELDWDFVPMMLNFTAAYLTTNAFTYSIFDASRELNTIIYNEIYKLRGKTDTRIILF